MLNVISLSIEGDEDNVQIDLPFYETTSKVFDSPFLLLHFKGQSFQINIGRTKHLKM